MISSGDCMLRVITSLDEANRKLKCYTAFRDRCLLLSLRTYAPYLNIPEIKVLYLQYEQFFFEMKFLRAIMGKTKS
jgi:hypothetical protein